MISRALDSNNDIMVANGRFRVVSDGAQVVQAVRSRLMFFLDEWFLDMTAGVPYYQKIFTKPADLVETESILKTQILRTEGVDKLTKFEMDFDGDTRLLTVSWSAETIYGTIDSDEVTINV